jgi:hypothetical protein
MESGAVGHNFERESVYRLLGSSSYICSTIGTGTSFMKRDKN